MVTGRRDAIDLVERSHRRQRPGVEAGLVRLEVNFAEPLLRHIDGVVVEAGLTRPISGEMLHACEEVVGRLEVASLEAPHSRRCEEAPEQNVLAATLDAAAPSLVARHVD